MSEKQKTHLNGFNDMAKFLCKLSVEEQKNIYSELNKFILEYLNNHEMTTISVAEGNKFTEEDNSFETFLRRAVYDFFETKKYELDAEILDSKEKPFNKNSHFFFYDVGVDKTYSRFLSAETTKKIFDSAKENLTAIGSDADNYTNTGILNIVHELYKCTKEGEKVEEKKIFPLDFIINKVNRVDNIPWDFKITLILQFADMDKNNFINKDKNFSDEEIYGFLNKLDVLDLETILNDKNLVSAFGEIDRLKNLLEIEKLEQRNNENAQQLARKLHEQVLKIDFSKAKTENEEEFNKNIEQGTGIKLIKDKDYERKVKRTFVMHQLPKSLASTFIFLFGFGLLFAAGFSWSVPFLLGIGFIIPSIVAFINSISCMRATKTNAWFAKLFKNLAWILDGALLITLGAVFCAGPLAIGCIVFGSLGILTGCLNAFVGTLNSMWNTQRELIDCEDADWRASSIYNIKTEILSHKIFTTLVFAVACAAGILLALNPAILPLALPFLPAIGIGIAVLSGLGLIKSALRLFFKDNYWQVGFYHAAKYIKAGMFVLGGLGLIALPFLPVTATLASLIGMPILVVNIFSFLVGLASAVKGCMSVTRMSSKIKFLLADLAMAKARDIKLPEKPININNWKNDLCKKIYEPKLRPGDISKDTCEKIFKE